MLSEKYDPTVTEQVNNYCIKHARSTKIFNVLAIHTVKTKHKHLENQASFGSYIFTHKLSNLQLQEHKQQQTFNRFQVLTLFISHNPCCLFKYIFTC